MADRLCLRAHLGTQQSLTHDSQGQGVHLPVKCGLHDPSLPQPKTALAGDEAISQNFTQPVVADGLLGEILWIVLKDVFHMLRVAEQVHAAIEEAQRDDVAVLCGRSREKPKWIRSKSAQVAERAFRPRTWGHPWSSARSHCHGGFHCLPLPSALARAR